MTEQDSTIGYSSVLVIQSQPYQNYFLLIKFSLIKTMFFLGQQWGRNNGQGAVYAATLIIFSGFNSHSGHIRCSVF